MQRISLQRTNQGSNTMHATLRPLCAALAAIWRRSERALRHGEQPTARRRRRQPAADDSATDATDGTTNGRCACDAQLFSACPRPESTGRMAQARNRPSCVPFPALRARIVQLDRRATSCAERALVMEHSGAVRLWPHANSNFDQRDAKTREEDEPHDTLFCACVISSVRHSALPPLPLSCIRRVQRSPSASDCFPL